MPAAVAVVIAGLIALLVWQPWRGSGEPGAPTPTGAASATPARTTAPDPTTSAPAGTPPPATPGPTQACTDQQITVTPVTDKAAYAAGELPKLSMSLENTSSSDCTLDVGTATQVFTVSSGADVWWRSTDCQANPASQLITVAAGQKVDSTQGGIPWDRSRSSADTCDAAERPSAPGGGATYHLAVSIGGIASTDTAAFTLD